MLTSKGEATLWEITDAVVRILDAAGCTLEWDRQLGGVAALDATGTPLPDIHAIPVAMKQKMAGKRVLIRVRPQRVISWDHSKLPSSKTPGAVSG